jgi:hypothetical protein
MDEYRAATFAEARRVCRALLFLWREESIGLRPLIPDEAST